MTTAAIKCISADGRSLHLLIIWSAATLRSTWATYPTPGWHFACSQSGYTDSKISFDWLRRVFEHQTKVRAGKLRILICDNFSWIPVHETWTAKHWYNSPLIRWCDSTPVDYLDRASNIDRIIISRYLTYSTTEPATFPWHDQLML
jgi:hypothetical protein